MKFNRLVGTKMRIGLVVVTAAVLSSCSSTGSTNLQSTTPAAMSGKDASKYFLSSVCPLDTSLHVVGNLAIAVGGWPNVDPKVGKNYIANAANVARTAAANLVDPKVVWPAGSAGAVKGTSRDILALIVPLQQMAQAATGADMAKPWSLITGQTRSDEQDLRLQLQLPPAGAVHDGCPAAPPVIVSNSSPSQKPVAPTKPTGSGPILDSEAINWQSASGNLRCSYFPHGSVGQSVACLDASTNTLVRLNTGLVRVSSATGNQVAQLPGGRVITQNNDTLFLGSLGDGSARFSCWQGADGMTCLDDSMNSWFIIRMGHVWTSG